MQKRKTGLVALVAALCVVLSVALCGVVARAAGDYTFSLSVKVTDSESLAVTADLNQANVKVDVYRVAEAQKDASYDTYNMVKWVKAFEDAGIKKDYEDIQEASKKDIDDHGKRVSTTDWEEFYTKAAKVVADNSLQPTYTADLGDDFTLEGEGLYLVIAHGDGEALDAENGYAGVAYGEKLKFIFPATMITAPTKAADENGAIYTDASYLDWLDEAEIVLKSSYEPLFGRLVVNKTVNDYKGDEATFVFHIYDSATKGEVYDNYAAITVNGQNTGATTVEHIPAGIDVTVDEDYAGARYKLASANGQTATIVSDHAVDASADDDIADASVSFVNEPNGGHPDGGHGIENHFDYDGGNWPITPTPEKPVTTTEAE